MSALEKEAFVKVYESRRSMGVIQAAFLQEASQAGFLIPESTFRGWVKQYEHTGQVGTLHDGRGQPKLLSCDDLDILRGWVVERLSKRAEIHLEDYKRAAQQLLNKKISTSVASRALKESKITLHTASSKASGFRDSNEALITSYWSWLGKQRQFRTFPSDLSQICSLDFTFTSHRKHRRTSFSPSGAAQPTSSHQRPLYTNCVLTCVWVMVSTEHHLFSSHSTPASAETGQKPTFGEGRKDTSRARCKSGKLPEIELYMSERRSRRHATMFLRALTCFVDSSKSTLCSLDGLHSPTMATLLQKTCC